MKSLTIIAFAIVCSHSAYAQKNEILNTNTSAAYVLMGFSPTEISRPSNLGEFTSAIANNSDQLTKLPKTIAMEFSPFLGKKKSKLYAKKDSKEANKCTSFNLSTFSFGFHSSLEGQVDQMTRIGFGYKLPICPPNDAKSITKENNEKISEYENSKQLNEKLSQSEVDLSKHESDLTKLQLKMIDVSKNFYKSQINLSEMILKHTTTEGSVEFTKLKDENNLSKSKLEAITNEYKLLKLENDLKKEEIEKLKLSIPKVITFIKQGMTIDLHMGTVMDFPTNKGSLSKFYKSGIWLVGGFENGLDNKISILGTAKLLLEHNIPEFDVAMSNRSLRTKPVYQGGARVLYNHKNINASIEFLYQNLKVQDCNQNSSKYAFNILYKFNNNTNLGVAFGKDFDNTITKEGNIFSMLNFIKSFGTND